MTSIKYGLNFFISEQEYGKFMAQKMAAEPPKKKKPVRAQDQMETGEQAYVTAPNVKPDGSIIL